MLYVTKFPSITCPLSLTSFSWFIDYLKKKIFCNVNFSLMSNRKTIFGMCVYTLQRQYANQTVSLDFDLISWISEQG